MKWYNFVFRGGSLLLAVSATVVGLLTKEQMTDIDFVFALLGFAILFAVWSVETRTGVVKS